MPRVIMVPLLAAICGVVPGCGATATATADQKGQAVGQPTKAQGEAIARRIGLTLPLAATVEYAEEIEGRDDAARLTVVLLNADWQKLRSSLPLSAPDQPPFTADANFHLGSDEGGWSPSKAKGLETIQLPWRDGKEALNLGVAPTDAGRTRLFVFWHRL